MSDQASISELEAVAMELLTPSGQPDEAERYAARVAALGGRPVKGAYVVFQRDFRAKGVRMVVEKGRRLRIVWLESREVPRLIMGDSARAYYRMGVALPGCPIIYIRAYYKVQGGLSLLLDGPVLVDLPEGLTVPPTLEEYLAKTAAKTC